MENDTNLKSKTGAQWEAQGYVIYVDSTVWLCIYALPQPQNVAKDFILYKATTSEPG